MSFRSGQGRIVSCIVTFTAFSTSIIESQLPGILYRLVKDVEEPPEESTFLCPISSGVITTMAIFYWLCSFFWGQF